MLGVAGQIALKSAALGSPTGMDQFINRLTLTGFAIYVIAALCYMSHSTRSP